MTKLQWISSATSVLILNSLCSLVVSYIGKVQTPVVEAQADLHADMNIATPAASTGGWASGMTGFVAKLQTALTSTQGRIKELAQAVSEVSESWKQDPPNFALAFGKCCVYSTAPAGLTTYLDQHYALSESLLPHTPLLRYMLAGTASGILSFVLSSSGPSALNLIGVFGDGFQENSAFLKGCFASLAALETVIFKSINEWDEKTSNQIVEHHHYYHSPEVGELLENLSLPLSQEIAF